MTRLLRYSVLRHCLPLVSAGLLFGLPGVAQNAPSTPGATGAGAPMQGGPAGPGGQRAPFKPKNLKVLPENTDLRAVMHGYEAALGVECEFCHVAPDPATHRSDKASDANPMKDQARAMIQMTDDINRKYLTLLSKNTPTYDVKDAAVTCGTCHRGQKHPAAFVPPRHEGERTPGAPGNPTTAPASGAPPTGVAPATRQ